MTKERANEIERRVFYKNVGFLTALNLNPEKMFELGRIAERMHIDLKNELSKEIDAIDGHDSEIRADERRKTLNDVKQIVEENLGGDAWRTIKEVLIWKLAEYEKEQKNERV